LPNIGIKDATCQCPSKTIQPTNPWRNDGVKLHEDKQYDAYIRVDDAEEHGESVERLIEDNVALIFRFFQLAGEGLDKVR